MVYILFSFDRNDHSLLELLDLNVQDPCPTYKTSTRSGALSTTGMSTNYILPVDIPTPEGRGPSYWILQGVAMLCALND